MNVRIALSDAARVDFGSLIHAVVPDARFVDPSRGEVADVAWASVDQYANGTLAAFYDGLAASPQLRWVQLAGAGTDDPAVIRLTDRGIRVLRGPDTGPVMAEFVLRAVLDRFQDASAWRAAQSRREWSRHDVRTIASSRWVVVGYGGVGRAVSRAAEALGARVVIVNRSRPTAPATVAWAPLADLARHAAEADVVVICLAATAQTRHIVDARCLAGMQPDAVLVNIARGALVDEAALLAAVDAGRPGFAVLDVAEVEPLPSSSPLWGHPQIAVTPHNAAAARDRRRWAAQLFCDRLRVWIRDGRVDQDGAD